MLRAMWRGLETGLRRLLYGHEEGNLGYGQEAAYGSPRQFPTLPGSSWLSFIGHTTDRLLAQFRDSEGTAVSVSGP
jgi:hypothetical protein